MVLVLRFPYKSKGAFVHHFLMHAESSEAQWEFCGVGEHREAKASPLTRVPSPLAQSAAGCPPSFPPLFPAAFAMATPSALSAPLPPGSSGIPSPGGRTYSPAAPGRRAVRSRRRTAGRCRSPRPPWRRAAPRPSEERGEGGRPPSAPGSAGTAMRAARGG